MVNGTINRQSCNNHNILNDKQQFIPQNHVTLCFVINLFNYLLLCVALENHA